jgi:Putative peptidoglycan binding domain
LRLENRVFQSVGIPVALLLMVISATATKTTTSAKPTHSSTTSIHKASGHSSSKSSKKKTTKHTAKSHGQRSMDEERTRQIQTALIKEHYLSGEPTGAWDQQSKDAMTRYQAANGWQTKLTPDSRALIKLGLGPDHKGLLNPETAVIPSPHELGIDIQAQPGGAAEQ